ncbi:MAG: hypothetical protein FWF63_02245 [Fibromonadales bacterium]|nr:hypothetical protein [Fibromonadales bacterium]
MKKLLLIFVLFASVSFAADKNALGLWVQGGNSGEWWGFDYKHLSSSFATDIYFRFEADEDIFKAGIYGGYYWLNNSIKADASMGKFPLHYGPIGGVGYWNVGEGPGASNGFAIRVGGAGGISWILPTSLPMDISIELNPVAEIHISSVRQDDGKDKSRTKPHIPLLYFRLLYHAYLF